MRWYVMEASEDGTEYTVLGELYAEDKDEALSRVAQYYEKPKADLIVERAE